VLPFHVFVIFFFNGTATTEIYTLSLHDALPISEAANVVSDERISRKTHAQQCRRAHGNVIPGRQVVAGPRGRVALRPGIRGARRSEEHTSELQSRGHLVCRLLLEKKKHTQTRSR